MDRARALGPPQFDQVESSQTFAATLTGTRAEPAKPLVQSRSPRDEIEIPDVQVLPISVTKFEPASGAVLKAARAVPAPVPSPAEIDPPRYVSVGSEYFGEPDTAAYGASVAELSLAAPLAPLATPTPRRVARVKIDAGRPRLGVSRSGKFRVVTELIPPTPDLPMPPGPQETPPLVPSRSAPTLGAPRPDRSPLQDFDVAAAPKPPSPSLSPRFAIPSSLLSPKSANRKAPAVPEIPGLKTAPTRAPLRQIASLKAPRVFTPPQPPAPQMHPLPEPVIREAPPQPQPKIGAAPEAPAPRIAPGKRREPQQPVGTGADPLLVAKTAPPKVDIPGGCFVNRGSNDRMILVCDGEDVTPGQVFRAVVEGESAFRGLRAFDQAERILDAYGFNPTRFEAMSQGPQTVQDVAFLRELRSSSTDIRVKGRPFDLYLMKGDKGVATVLVEQAAAPDRASIRPRS